MRLSLPFPSLMLKLPITYFSGERQHFDSGESRNSPRYLIVRVVGVKIFINVFYFSFCSFFYCLPINSLSIGE